MQTRVAVMAVIVEDDDAAEKLNAVLHHYGEHIIGRMGIPDNMLSIMVESILSGGWVFPIVRGESISSPLQ